MRGKSLLHLTQENKSANRGATLLKLNALLEKSLRAAGRDDLADKVAGCHRSFIGWGCDHGHRWARPEKSCQIRLCAFEMRARSMRAFHRMEKPLADLQQARYAVLSERNVPLGQLEEGIAHLFESFERLRHLAIWRFVRAAVAVLEITFNRHNRTWHPHLNIIFDGPFIPQRGLAVEWEKATRGRGRIVWIDRLDSAIEAFKYVTKLADIADVPEAVEEFIRATHGLRFLRTYGALYRLPEEENFELTCPDCGTTGVQRLGFLPFEAVQLDGQGVLRFDDSLLVASESPPPIDTSRVAPLTVWPKSEFPLSQIQAA